MAELKMILARDRAGEFQMWACRDNGKGCKRNRYRKGIPCDDCLGPLPETMTLGEVRDKVDRDDA